MNNDRNDQDEIKSPQFTDPKQYLAPDGSTAQQTIAPRTQLSSSRSASAFLEPAMPKQVQGQNKFAASQMNPALGWEREKLWAEPTGVSYVEYTPVELSSRERGRPLLEHSQLSGQGTSPSIQTIADPQLLGRQLPSKQPIESQSGRLKDGRNVEGPVESSYHRSHLMPGSPHSPALPKHLASEDQYRYFSAQSSRDVGLSALKDNSSWQELAEEPGHEQPSTNWQGFSILKRYVSKERFERPVQNTRPTPQQSALNDKYADVNLVQAFFKESPNKESAKSQVETHRLEQDSEQVNQAEHRQMFSKMNTFGQYSSQQTVSWDASAKKMELSLKAFMNPRQTGQSPEEKKPSQPPVKQKPSEPCDVDRAAQKMTINNPSQKNPMKDSYLDRLVSKVSSTSRGVIHFGSPQFKPTTQISSYRDKSKSGQPKLGYANPQSLARDSEGTLSTPFNFGTSRPQAKVVPIASHQSHARLEGNHVAPKAQQNGHSYRKLKVDIASLIQRTLPDLNP